MYIPPGFGTVTPYCIVNNADRFVEFLVRGFRGIETLRHMRPDGKIANALVRLGTTTIMVSEASAKYPPMPASYYLYVENADQAVKHAIDSGATLEMEPKDMPYGDRQGGVRDAHGNIWWISQRTLHEPYTP